MITWVTPENLRQSLETISNSNCLGLDTEFDSVDLSWQSTVGTSRLDVMSLSKRAGAAVSPRGITPCDSWVIPDTLVTAFRDIVEDPRIVKYVHNQPVDAHTLYNAGLTLRGAVNTLSWARWLYPERVNLLSGAFDLGSLCQWRFGRDKTEDFFQLFGYEAEEEYDVSAWYQFCVTCARFGCRKKIGHEKEKREQLVTRRKKVRKIIPLHEVRPGHPLFERYLIYAAIDAELALQLAQCMEADGSKEVDFPWPQHE